MTAERRFVTTDVPARLDRLPWSRFHWVVIIALGITWVLDGLEVTLAGSLAGALRESPSLHFSAAEVGLASSAYVAGAVTGALFFGWLTDRLGRKRLFSVTLLLYLLAAAGTAFTWNLSGYALMRFLTGAGIGGEFSAINSAIQELIPPRFRWPYRSGGERQLLDGRGSGRCRVAGAARPSRHSSGLRMASGIFHRRRDRRADPVAAAFRSGKPTLVDAARSGRPGRGRGSANRDPRHRSGHTLPPLSSARVRLRANRTFTPLSDVFHTLLRRYPRRTVLCLGLMIAQAFFYNAIFFTYAMLLTDFYGVNADQVGLMCCRSRLATCLDRWFSGHCSTPLAASR